MPLLEVSKMKYAMGDPERVRKLLFTQTCYREHDNNMLRTLLEKVKSFDRQFGG